MTVVLVHGNPETAALWRPLVAELDRDDVVTLSPPGFGASMPHGFAATSDEYVDWLVSSLELIGEPVDLVGHDWGANFALRVACERPDLLRSWCVDTAGVWAPDYLWPEASNLFRTPAVGEGVINALLAMGPEGRQAIFQPTGIAPDVVAEMAAAIDEEMGRCVLGIYRSADEAAFSRWREQLPTASSRPGLVLAVVGDHLAGTEAQHRWTAERAGAEMALFERLGHWWMLHDPAAGAAALRRFWDSL
jgi:pimeloyl-ACP methyl ester carboxylesterase